MVDVKPSTDKRKRKPEIEAEAKPEVKEPDKVFKPGTIQYADGKLMIPPGIQTKLQSIGSKYGIPFDLANITVGDGKMAEKVKALSTIVEMAVNDSKLLPEMLKLIKKLLKSEIKLAKFHKKLTAAAIEHQVKLDKQVADIAVMMSGFQAKSNRLEKRTNGRLEIIEKRTQLLNARYENSVFGEESRLVDVEFQLKASNDKLLADSKEKQLNAKAEKKKRAIDYVNSALEG